MSEVSIAAARAAVYFYDPPTKGWKPQDSGLSRVNIYHHTGNNTWRVVAVDEKEHAKVSINSAIFKKMPYQRASENFHQWTDSRNSYGLNFATQEEAQVFAECIDECLKQLDKDEVSNTHTLATTPSHATLEPVSYTHLTLPTIYSV
eukprot:TRINITY_DN1117_c0_g2_i1.p1 TRINITY_DN1117_c0_g2~~TRINITY_DN1117_c0_g2_i1.p1  ORF type:complete len:147 (-),score=18.27 TRINITY_DN1117_c0_g2_i1:1-441(-)